MWDRIVGEYGLITNKGAGERLFQTPVACNLVALHYSVLHIVSFNRSVTKAGTCKAVLTLVKLFFCSALTMSSVPGGLFVKPRFVL